VKASLWLQYAGYLKMPAMALSVNGVHFLDAGIYDSHQKCFEGRFFFVYLTRTIPYNHYIISIAQVTGRIEQICSSAT
jgi:hypothetical protein